MKVRALNENTPPKQFEQRLADLAAEVAELSGRVQSIEADRDCGTHAEPASLTVHSYDDDDGNSIHFLTENGFVIVRPWEAKDGRAPQPGAYRFQVQHPDGIDQEIKVEISSHLANETASRHRIHPVSEFWICCAERRLANYLMEHGELPPAKEILIETLNREDLLLAIRWGKT